MTSAPYLVGMSSSPLMEEKAVETESVSLRELVSLNNLLTMQDDIVWLVDSWVYTGLVLSGLLDRLTTREPPLWDSPFWLH